MGGAAVTEVERTEIWDRRCAGESMSAIAKSSEPSWFGSCLSCFDGVDQLR